MWFVVPAAIAVLGTILFPWAFTLYVSAFDWRLGSPREFVGFANYTKLFTDERFGWALLAAVVVNLAFHLDYQSRGSVYIYAAHLHFPIFALGTGALAYWAALGRWQRGLQLAVLTALVVLTAATSLVRVQQLVEHLQHTRVSPDAPEVRP